MKKALILDVSSILYRSFYKLGGMSNSKQFPTGALFGFVNNILSLKEKYDPQYIVACLDVVRSSLKRREVYSEYKSKRDSAPEDLVKQLAMLPKLLKALDIQVLTKDGYEADDMIASAVEYFHPNVESYVVSSDKDLMQLVPKAKIVRDTLIETEEKVKDIIGVYPNKICDLFALMGDGSDGIPGVKGVGPKTAIKLINEYGDIDTLLKSLDKLPAKLKIKISENIDKVHISKHLAELDIVKIDKIDQHVGFKDDLKDILEELEFKSVLKKLGISTTKEEIIEFEEVDSIKSNFFVYQEGKYYTPLDNKVVISNSVEIDDKIDTFDAKELYKIRDIDLDLDLKIGYHLLFPEERITLDRIARRLFNSDNGIAYLSKLRDYIKAELKAKSLVDVYENIEKPLIPVLARMESKGVTIDVDKLSKYGDEISVRLAELERSIFNLAGEEFNIASPKQLGHILFEKLNIPPLKKNKSGYSTDVDVLYRLKEFDIVKNVLEYRKLYKLKSTYINPLNSRVIKSKYNQDGTATGRLSSSNPNLQNIPSRTSDGLRIRESFISARDYLLVLDYSQIELRILASISKSKGLIDSYLNDKDLHSMTAIKLFGSDAREYREKAKVVNFSLIYGKSAFGLAKELDISIKDASQYIDLYFKEYPEVKEFISKSISLAKERGFVETLGGRRRYLEGINSKNSFVRSANERAAINTIIQGSQAEIIKKAMIEIDKYILDKDIDMVIQVHDELVIEIDEHELDRVKDIVNIMENSHSLDIPVKVNYSIVKNWSEAK